MFVFEIYVRFLLRLCTANAFAFEAPPPSIGGCYSGSHVCLYYDYHVAYVFPGERFSGALTLMELMDGFTDGVEVRRFHFLQSSVIR